MIVTTIAVVDAVSVADSTLLRRIAVGADDVAAELPSEQELARRDDQAERVPA